MSLVSLAGIIGPSLFAGSFGYFIGKSAPVHWPSAPWFIAAALLACAVVLAWVFAKVPAEGEARGVAATPEA
jgi:DHA1 family tetracycline resistance protein-like MFS transporter